MEMLPGSPRPTVATGRLYGLNLSRMKRTRCIQLSLVPRPLPLIPLMQQKSSERWLARCHSHLSRDLVTCVRARVCVCVCVCVVFCVFCVLHTVHARACSHRNLASPPPAPISQDSR
jgi:hypothetical protein